MREAYRREKVAGGFVMATETDRAPLEEPLAELERQLIGAYVAGAGQDLAILLTRDDKESKQLLAEASLFATEKLTEVESRSDYLRRLHGQP
jgi:hypothetical protein